MKRTYPYTGPGSQAQGAPQSAYGQPPPPAGPAPPLPSSGSSQAAYANYGYGPAQQWPQPQPQQPQQYYPQQRSNAVGAPGAGHFAAPRPPSQAGPYRGVTGPNAGSSPVNQGAAYSPHQPQQPVPYSYQPQAPHMQSQSPMQHHQPPAPTNYGYAPSMPPHQQNVAASAANNNGNAQTWPGAYPPGVQGGPPNKKPRYQASPAPAPSPAAPYGPSGVAPMAQVGANPYSPQQPYGWQAQNAAPPPHMNPQPVSGHPVPPGRVASGSGVHASAMGNGGPFAPPARNDRAGKAGAGGGMPRKGAQNRGNMQKGASGQRAGLPANPAASVNAARAPHGQTRAWGSKALGGSGTGPPSQHGDGNQAGRRVSSASSVHSDKNFAGGSVKKHQSMTLPDAPRGPNNARNKAAAGSSGVPTTGSQTMKNGSGAAGQGGRGSGVASKNAGAPGSMTGDATGMDASSSASSKRAHTDFRILGLEIKQLDWSWFSPQALAPETKNAVPKQDEVDSGEASATAAAESAPPKDQHTDAKLADAGQEDEGRDADEADDFDDQRSTTEDEHANDKTQEDDKENLDHDEQASNIDADADHDDEADADADADADGDQDAEGDPDADAEEDVAMSHADTDTAASEHQHSVAPDPEPKDDPSKIAVEAASQNGKASRAERARSLANLRDSTKLRLCFAAMSNAGPEGAPTGPKPFKIQETLIKTENGVHDESAVDQSEQEPVENRVAKEISADENDAQGEDVTKSMVSSEFEAKEGALPVGSDDVQGEQESAHPANDASTAIEAAGEEEESIREEEQEKHDENAKDGDDDPALSSTASKVRRPDSEPPAKGPPQLSLNRIFLSFAANRKRLAIDAEAVKSVKIHRSEHWIEICVDADRQADQMARKKGEGYLVCRGTLLEKRGKGQENYTAVTRSDIAAAWEVADAEVKAEEMEEEHLELPPFFRLDESSAELVLQVHLDPSAPLPEPAWLRKNDVNELLASLQRSSTAIAGTSDTAVSVGTAQHVWAGKIEVLDPDPPPSMSTFLYEWVKESFIGSQRERRKFVDDMLGRRKKKESHGADEVKQEDEAAVAGGETEAERDARVARSFVEIVLRLMKGERVSTSPESDFASLLSTTSYTSSTTYPGLFMLGLLDVGLSLDAGRIRTTVDKLLMAMPRATLVKAVDLTWKDVVEGGRKNSAIGTGTAVAASGRGAATNRNRHHRQHRTGATQPAGQQGGRFKRKRG